jgi:hypothetical protein
MAAEKHSNMPLFFCFRLHECRRLASDSVGFGDISRIARVEDIATTPTYPREMRFVSSLQMIEYNLYFTHPPQQATPMGKQNEV